MTVDAQKRSASAASAAGPAHSARVEFELASGRPVGSIVVDGGRPARFEGFDQLERIIASLPGPRPLVLVRSDDAPVPENGLADLTPREHEIAVAAARGASNREIADSLFYSVKSIEAYLTRAYRKLAVSGRADLAALVTQEPAEVEDLEVPDRVGAELSGGRSSGPARVAGGRVKLDLVLLAWNGEAAGSSAPR